MSSVTIAPPSTTRDRRSTGSNGPSPLPKLLQTPLGLALIEMQGNINHPSQPEGSSSDLDSEEPSATVGRLVFPDYKGEEGEGAWTKRVWLYIGEHQRMTGEAKKLKIPLGMLRRKTRDAEGSDDGMMEDLGDDGDTELEIADIIKWKITFASRPEPVGVV